MNPTENPKKKIQDNDFKLIESINTDQPEQFVELVKRYEKQIYNFGLRTCHDPQDAQDLVQETFIAVFKYLKQFRYETKFKNWLYKIAVSICIKKKRKSKFAPDREISLDSEFTESGYDMLNQIPDWASMPLESLLTEELTDMVHKAVLSLPEKYRWVIVLRDMEGFNTLEAAHILDISPSNVKVRLHRARLYLRDKLKGYFEND